MSSAYTPEQIQAFIAQLRNSAQAMKRMEVHEIIWTDGKKGTVTQGCCSHMGPLLKRILLAHCEEEIAEWEKTLLFTTKGGTNVVEN